MEDKILYDLCVAGAGMFGSAAARHASSNPALKVCLIGPGEPTVEEKKTREVFSSHYDEGRITRISDDDPACQVLSERSIDRYKELEKLSGIKFYTPVGTLFVCQKETTYLQELLRAKNKDVSTVDLSDREILQRRYPYLNLKKDEVALLEDYGAGHISPRKMVEAQKRVAESQGCVIYEDVVSEVRLLDGGHYQVEMKDSKNTVKARRILIATGAFINTMISVLKPLKVKKYKKTATLIKISTEEAERLSSMPSIIYRGKSESTKAEAKDVSAYILPPIKYPNGNYYLKIGYQGKDRKIEKLTDMREWFMSDGEKDLIDLGSELLQEMLPSLVKESIHGSTCINCYTPNGIPYIDRITPTLTVAVGGNGKGAKLSDEVGRLAAELSVHGRWDSTLPQSRFEADFEDS